MARRYGRRKRRKKKYSVSRSKLADKKINTLFEKRALQIAKKEVKASHEWFVSKMVTKDPQFDWVAAGPYLRVPSASCFSLNAGTLQRNTFAWHLRLSDLGTLLENSLNQPTDPNDSITNDLRISSFRSCFDFRYAGASDCLIDISICKVNGSQLLSASTPVPTIEMVQPLNQLYKYWAATQRQSLGFKFQRIAHKRVKLGKGVLYTDSRVVSNAGSNQGYNFTTTATIHTDPARTVSIMKSFKGKGARLYVENAVRPPQTEYYLMIVADRPIEFCAVHATRFRLEKAAAISQPGNA